MFLEFKELNIKRPTDAGYFHMSFRYSETNSWQCQVSGLTELRRKQKQEKTQKTGPEKKYRNEISIKIGNCN